METSQRVFQADTLNIEALNFTILNHICRETDYGKATECITKLIQALDRLEPKNPHLYAQVNIIQYNPSIRCKNPDLLFYICVQVHNFGIIICSLFFPVIFNQFYSMVKSISFSFLGVTPVCVVATPTSCSNP